MNCVALHAHILSGPFRLPVPTSDTETRTIGGLAVPHPTSAATYPGEAIGSLCTQNPEVPKILLTTDTPLRIVTLLLGGQAPPL